MKTDIMLNSTITRPVCGIKRKSECQQMLASTGMSVKIAKLF